MDNQKFQMWCTENSVPESVRGELFATMSALGPDADVILDNFLAEKTSFMGALMVLKNRKVDIVPLIRANGRQVIASSSTMNMPNPPKQEVVPVSSKRSFPNLNGIFPRPKASQGAGPKNPQGSGKTGKMLDKKVMIIGGAILVLIILVIAGLTLLNPAKPESSNSYVIPSLQVTPSKQAAGSNNPTKTNEGAQKVITEEKPKVENPNPLDLGSTDWVKDIQLLFIIQIIGMIIALLGDSFVKQQWLDAIAGVGMAVLAIVLVLPPGTQSWVVGLILAFMIAMVTVVSVTGGRDFSPLATFFLIAGVVGGVLFHKIGIIESFGIKASAVLPFVQQIDLMRLKDTAGFVFPLVVFGCILLANVFALIEGFRPSEEGKNRNPRWGTIAGAGIGIAVFFGMHYLLFSSNVQNDVAGPTAYAVAFAVSLALSALTQHPLVANLAGVKWGIRTIFDAPMLLTTILILIQMITGRVGF